MNKSSFLFRVFLIFSVFCLLFSCSAPKHDPSTLRINVSSEPDSFFPWKSTAADTKAILYNIFEGLYGFDEKGTAIPCLAESVSISEDKLTYTFTLRQNVKFHNGKAFTSQDAAYTYKNLAGLEGCTPTSDSMSVVKSVSTPDDYTFVVELKNPCPRFLYLATAPILPENYDDHETKPVGTGPYVFDSYQIRHKIILKENENYWNKEKAPKIPNVEINIITDEAATIAALQSGQLDVAQMLSPGNAKALSSSYTLVDYPQNMVQIFAMNNKVVPFNDIRVRKAVAAAINKDEIVTGVLDGFATKLYSNFSPVLAHYYNGRLTDMNPYNVEKARLLLAEAGYPDGFDITITVPGNYQVHVDTAQIILNNLAEIGIKATIKTVEWTTWLSEVYSEKNYETTVIAFSGKLDPSDILKRYSSSYKKNFVNFYNEYFDNAYNSAINETDDTKAVEEYKECQAILAEESPCVFICDPNNIVLMQNYVKGFTYYPVLYYDFSSMYFED